MLEALSDVQLSNTNITFHIRSSFFISPFPYFCFYFLRSSAESFALISAIWINQAETKKIAVETSQIINLLLISTVREHFKSQ